MARPLGAQNKKTLAMKEQLAKSPSGVPAYDVLRKIMEHYWDKAQHIRAMTLAMHPQDVARPTSWKLYEESADKACGIAQVVIKYERSQLASIQMDVSGSVENKLTVVLPPGDWDKRASQKRIAGPTKSNGSNGTNGTNGHAKAEGVG